MGYKKISILGVNFTIAKKSDILEEVKKYLKLGTRDQGLGTRKEIEQLVIFTPNPEIVTFAQKNPDFKKIVNSAQINIPDGWGICWAAKKIYGLEIERISGADLMLDLCRLSTQEGFTIGLIGGSDGVAVLVRECLLKSFPKLKIEVLEAPEVKVSGITYQVSGIKNKVSKNTNILNTKYLILNIEENQEEITEQYFKNLVKEIVEKRIDILFVALGFPKQEFFISILNYQLSIIHSNRSLVLMAVGGAFDYISGRVPRAPVWMRDRGLEWLYRLIREPWRLPRQLKGAEFFYRVITTPKA